VTAGDIKLVLGIVATVGVCLFCLVYFLAR
jgi:hypothetical protein